MEDNQGKPHRIPRSIARAVALPRSWGTSLEWGLIDGRSWLLKSIGFDGVTPGSSCIVNSYSSHHDEIIAPETGTMRG
jgi:hypothetical protein